MGNTSKVLTMGDQIVEVHRVIPPKLVGGMGERERVGKHGVVWHGKSSEDAVDRGDRVVSGVLGLDVTKFTINVHKHAFAEPGIFSMPYPEVWQDNTWHTKLWYVLALRWQDSRYDKLVSVTGSVVARKTTVPPFPDLVKWWKGIKSLTGCTDASRSIWDEQVRIEVRRAGQGSRLTIYLQWQASVPRKKFEETAWSHMVVPEGLHEVQWAGGVMGANIQGSGRSKERTESKWDEIQATAAATGATVLLMQEMWGGKIKQRDRALADFWGESSQHQKRGQHNEVWCKSQWATRVAVIMDAPFALMVLAKGVPGLGVLVSVHMAQRKEEQKYEEQLLAIQAAINTHPNIWIIIGGDWNRDIRTHATSQRILGQMGVGVVPMDGKVHLPKDFVAYRGIKAPQQGQWLEKVGDHPIVWAPTQACKQPHESGVQTKPVVKNKWTEGGEKMFSDLLEAVSRSHCTVQVVETCFTKFFN